LILQDLIVRSRLRLRTLRPGTDWIGRLSEVEIAEVERAAKELAKSSIDLTSLSSDDFPLPTLGLRLHDLMDEVLGDQSSDDESFDTRMSQSNFFSSSKTPFQSKTVGRCQPQLFIRARSS
jgi:hypothetical protein